MHGRRWLIGTEPRGHFGGARAHEMLFPRSFLVYNPSSLGAQTHQCSLLLQTCVSSALTFGAAISEPGSEITCNNEDVVPDSAKY
jgi:hypothetical protein